MFQTLLDPKLAIRGDSPGIAHREYWIDYLRGLAAISVALFHFNETERPEIPIYSDIVSYGWLGVPVFFFLSGYCIQISAQSSRSTLSFLVRRSLRIYLPYWSSLLICCTIIVLALLVRGVNDAAPLPASLADFIILIFAFTGSPYEAKSLALMNWSYWTLAYELAFYAVVFIALISRSLYWIVLTVFLILSFLPLASSFLFFLDNFRIFALGLAAAAGTVQLQRGVASLLGALALVSVFLSTDNKSIIFVALALVAFFAGGVVLYYPEKTFFY